MAAITLGTALAVSAIASGAGAAAKGVAAAKAAKNAAKQQVAGTQAASQHMNQGFGSLSQVYAPYLNNAQASAQTLGRLVIPGAGARYASAPPPNAMPPSMGNTAVPRQQRPMQGPYMMAAGGDFQVNEPTMFIAGEAGPERATFSGAQGPSATPGMSAARPDVRTSLLAKYGGPRPPAQGGTFAQMGQGQMPPPQPPMPPQPPQPPQVMAPQPPRPPMPPQLPGGGAGFQQ